MPTTLELQVLGEMRLFRDAEEKQLPPSKKTRALLAYLALTQRAHSRQRLSDLLWDVTDDRRGALRWSLSRLRPLVNDDGVERLVADRDSIRFVASGAHIDFREIGRLVDGGLGEASTEDLERAAWKFRGELLEGLALSDFADFEAWLVAERERARRWHAAILAELVSRLSSHPSRALPFARTWLQIDRENPASKQAFDALVRSGSRARMESELAPLAPPRISSSSSSPRIAVIPFRNAGDDERGAFLADGIAEELITVLSKISGLTVIARQSSFALRDTKELDQIASVLGAHYLVMGTVRHTDGRVRVSAQLTDTGSAEIRWAGRFDAVIEDVLSVQDEIADRIVTALEVRLTLGEQVRLWRRRAGSLEAYEHYLRGVHYYNRFRKEDNLRARHELERAIALSPEFAAAYHYLGWVCTSEGWLGWSESREAALEEALKLADHALELDATLADAHAVRGFVFALRGEFERAVLEGERALALNPNGANVLHVLAMSKNFSGQPEEAIILAQQALRLSPIAPPNVLVELGRAYCQAGRFEEALPFLLQAADIEPDWLSARTLLVMAYAELGRSMDARAQVEEILRINPSFSVQRYARRILFQDRGTTDRFSDILRHNGLPP